MHLDDRPTAIYRLFDAADVLLYIGITHDPEQRMRSHAATKTWWGSVARCEVEWRPDRRAAELAEVAAIGSEAPVHNRDDNPRVVRRVVPGVNEVTVSQASSNLGAVAERVEGSGRAWFILDRGRRRGALVPVALGELVESVGGPDAAVRILAEAGSP